MILLNVIFNRPANLENSTVATGLEKVRFHSNPKEGQCQKMFKLSYNIIALISQSSKFILKIFQASLQQYVNQKLPDVQAGFQRVRGTRDQIAKFDGSQRKQESYRKTSSASWIMLKHLTMQITTNWKILQEMGIPDHLTCLLRNLYADQEQQLEPDMEEQTGSKLGKKYIKAVYCDPTYLTSLQSTLCKMPVG